MALNIILIPDYVSEYWMSEESIPHSSILHREWAAAFFCEFKIRTYDNFITQELGVSEDFDAYLEAEFSRISRTFPMLGRIKDYYVDARFSENETKSLQLECKSLVDGKVHPDAAKFFLKVDDACSVAIKKSMGILFSAD